MSRKIIEWLLIRFFKKVAVVKTYTTLSASLEFHKHRVNEAMEFLKLKNKYDYIEGDDVFQQYVTYIY